MDPLSLTQTLVGAAFTIKGFLEQVCYTIPGYCRLSTNLAVNQYRGNKEDLFGLSVELADRCEKLQELRDRPVGGSTVAELVPELDDCIQRLQS